MAKKLLGVRFLRTYASRTILFTSLLIIGIVLAQTLVFIQTESAYLQDRLIEDKKSLTELLAINLSVAQMAAGFAFQSNLIEEASATSDTIYIRFAKPSGEIYLSTMVKERGNFIKDPAININKTIVKDDIYNGETIKVVVSPASRGYTVWLGFSLHSVHTAVNERVRDILLVAFAILIIANLIAYFIAKRMTYPLRELRKGVEAIGRGDFSQQVEVSSQDEVGQLASTFNQMASDLSESRKEIEQYTLELKANNEQLQREITERKQAEEELASVVEGMLEAVAIIDFDGTIRQVNSEFARGSGWKREELVGKTMSELGIMSEEEGQKIEKKVTPKLMKEGFVHNIETITTRRDGTKFPVLMSWTLKKDAEGKPTGIITVARDITEYKRMQEVLQKARDGLERRVKERTTKLTKANEKLQAEIAERKRIGDELMESEERFRIASQIASDVVYERDLQTGIATFYGDIDAHLGYEPGCYPRTLEGWREHVHPEDLAWIDGQSIDQLEPGVPHSIEYRMRKKDGTYMTWVDQISIIADEKTHKPLKFIGVATEITKRKQAEEELQKTIADLERSNTELERFAYIASHDLQEPLRMVASYTQLLEKRYKDRLDADAHDFIGYAVDGAKRMQELINDLLTYSRVGTRGRPFEPTDCMTVFAAAVANLDVAIRNSDAEVTSDPLPPVTADEGQLVQLFQNLIDNAIKFHGEEPPHVHVSVEQREDEWVFSVQDNGIGIEPQYLKNAFGVFQRLHSGEYPGTGIGLSISKRIVERHGGRIWLESEPGKGTTVHFTIPVKRGKQS